MQQMLRDWSSRLQFHPNRLVRLMGTWIEEDDLYEVCGDYFEGLEEVFRDVMENVGRDFGCIPFAAA